MSNPPVKSLINQSSSLVTIYGFIDEIMRLMRYIAFWWKCV